ncbi:phosphoenolpyruvate--protein phosphotransferase [Plasticicumulans acidivorans]|uniref:phosphoenolpyruvate--protein phosphotransferase n=1 Tax=Plasticicumulans acidivorans TaxID=886464 RepID=A0A317MWL4_9GAMM|nr:phosphoenolpyruvate--protein phosphotransferase [Plasticicumulans acidivorans]PWV62473.1 PTSINtr with GAF domain PtsP [Plasticicumulans acidivorans]
MLDSLQRIVQEVNTAHDLDEALALIVERVKATMAADVCSVYLSDESRAEYVLMATDGLRPGAVGRVRIPFGKGLVGLCASRAEPVNVENAPDHPQFLFVATTGESPFHGFLGVPIVRRRKVMGVLVVQQRQQRRYVDDEVAFMVTLAAQLAGSITQAELRQALDRMDVDDFAGTLFVEGVASARGLGIGQAVVIFTESSLSSVPDRPVGPDDVEAECERFRAAVATELAELRELGTRMGRILSPGDQALFDAYAMLLGSDSLMNGTLARVRAGNWAPGALRDTVAEYANVFEEMDDAYLRGRAADIRDLGDRLLKRLRAGGATAATVYPERCVLVGEEINVSQLLDVPPEKLVGLVSVRGTGASHVALLARGLGIPAVFGVSSAPLTRLNGREVVVDGYSARICIQPGAALREEYLKLAREEADLSQGLQELKDQPAMTPDGHRVSLLANSGLFADINAARDSGAEGVGLYRSEMHFFLRDRFPGEDEQTETYARVLASMAPRPVTLRTLDVGGDKPLPYFPIEEQNPFLGWRGIRISLDQPDIFKTQLRAILRAAAQTGAENVSVLFPMITVVAELDEALELLRRAHAELAEDGVTVNMPRVGVMIEVPAAVCQIELLAQRVDFVSVGSNDLTQYLLAVDRNNDRVAKLYDSLNPAVLGVMQWLVERARRVGVPVSVCGEMAGDPAAALLLLGMGVDSLSMSLGNLMKVKWMIRSVPLSAARDTLTEALTLDCAQKIRARVDEALLAHGLGALVRPGRK